MKKDIARQLKVLRNLYITKVDYPVKVSLVKNRRKTWKILLYSKKVQYHLTMLRVAWPKKKGILTAEMLCSRVLPPCRLKRGSGWRNKQ